jgi:phosphatidylglycerophosphatase A
VIAAAFIAFRFFDIFKIGVHWVERRGWPGGIVWDDVLSGLYGGTLVWAAQWLAG